MTLKKSLHILPWLTEVKRDAVQRNLDSQNQEQTVDKSERDLWDGCGFFRFPNKPWLHDTFHN